MRRTSYHWNKPMAKNSEVLGFLRVQFARIENKIERLAGDLIEIKQRVTALEIQLGSFAATEQTHYGTAMQRFDRLETRINRIERRLDVIDPTP
jgi:phage shock protein A